MQELKGLGPVSPSKAPAPYFVKTNVGKAKIETERKSPSTRIDPDKPRMLTKAKAEKLVLLQKTIN
jgi:hypothetical protein